MKRFITLSVLLAMASVASADNEHKQSRDLPSGISNSLVDVIIQFNQGNSRDLDNNLDDVVRLLARFGQQQENNQQQGQRDNRRIASISALHVKVPIVMLPFLRALPAVRYVSLNRPATKFLDLSTAAVNASSAWQSGWDGTGVGVAVIDSGVALDKDLTKADGVTSRVVYSESFVSGQNAADAYGHGTHVAGIIGSAGRDSSGTGFTRTFKGVAPNVNLINLRVLDQNGAGMESDVIAAIDRAIALKTTYNIRVINLSLGHPVYESYTLDPLCQAVEAAWKAGIVVVVAAGNYGRDNTLNTKGYGTIASPGNDPYVITVGAMNTNGTVLTGDDKIASYSSRGPTLVDHIVKPDLVAPGNAVISLLVPGCTLAVNYPKTLISDAIYHPGVAGNSTNYFRLSGTSMATPVVAGAAALLLQKQPTLTPDQVKARLMRTATKTVNLYSTGTDSISGQNYSNQSDIFTVGAGYLNILNALTSNDLATKPALSPKASYNTVTKKISIARNFSVTWGDSVIWGDAAVWGNIVFSKLKLTAADDDVSVLWGDSVIWGDSVTSGFSVIWGDSVNSSTSLQALAAGDDDL